MFWVFDTSALLQVPWPRMNWSYCGCMFMSRQIGLSTLLLVRFLRSTPLPLSHKSLAKLQHDSVPDKQNSPCPLAIFFRLFSGFYTFYTIKPLDSKLVETYTHVRNSHTCHFLYLLCICPVTFHLVCKISIALYVDGVSSILWPESKNISFFYII